jgi:hypothetical protein
MDNSYFCESCSYFTPYNAHGYIGVCGAGELPTTDRTDCIDFLDLKSDQGYVAPDLVILPAKPKLQNPTTHFGRENIIHRLISISTNSQNRDL